MKKYKEITDLEILKLGAIPYVVSGLYFGPATDKFLKKPTTQHELIEIISGFLLAYEIDYLNNNFEIKISDSNVKKLSTEMTNTIITLRFKEGIRDKKSKGKEAYYNFLFEIMDLFLQSENRYIVLAETLKTFLLQNKEISNINFRSLFSFVLNLIDDVIKNGLLENDYFKKFIFSLNKKSKFSTFKYVEKGVYLRNRNMKTTIITIAYKNNVEIRILDHNKKFLKESIMFEASGKWLDVVNFQFEFMKFKFGQKK